MTDALPPEAGQSPKVGIGRAAARPRQSSSQCVVYPADRQGVFIAAILE